MIAKLKIMNDNYEPKIDSVGLEQMSGLQRGRAYCVVSRNELAMDVF